MPDANAQGEAWVIGNQRIDLTGQNGTYTVQSLPTVSGGYSGQSATRSQVCRTDGAGHIIFFMVDGAIYDGNGYLIADNSVNGSVEKIYPGVNKVLAIPVPQSCSMYYIITCLPSQLPGQGGVYIGILDMAAQNNVHYPNDPTKRGHLVNFENNDLSLPQYASFADSFTSLVTSPGSDHLKRLPYGNDPQKFGWIDLAAMDPHWTTGSQANKVLLHVTLADKVIQFKLSANAVEFAWSHVTGILSPGTDDWSHDSEFGLEQSTGQLLFAVTCNQGSIPDVTPLPNTPGYYPFSVWHLNSSTGALLNIHGYDPTNSNGVNPDQIYGVALNATGTRAFFTRSGNTLNLGYIDLATGITTNLTTLFTINNPGNKVFTHIERNVAPDGQHSALFYAYNGGIAALVDPDNLGNASWVDQLPVSSALNSVPQGTAPYCCVNPPRLLNGQVFQDQGLQTFQGSTCCVYRNSIQSSAITSLTGQNSWTSTNNPFGNVSEVKFAQDLVVQPGANISVSGMMWRFAENARLIVKPGGYIKFNNSNLTSYSCDGARWPGIRVEGNKNALQTIAYQGKLWLSGSTVSNARIGVRCAKELPGAVDQYGYYGPMDANGTGGILWTTNSTFRNCLTGADLGDYSHSPGSLTVNDNVSLFTGTRFVTEFPMPDMQVPKNHLSIHGTRKVNISGCSFANDAPNFFPVEQWGTGINVYNAEVLVQGYSSPTSSYVRNLQTGIWRTGSPKVPITVDGMRFSGNRRGVQDDGGYFSRYTNNKFSVPDQGAGGGTTRREGIRLNQTRHFTVERNSFTGQDPAIEPDEYSIGIFFLGIAPVPNGTWNYSAERIYDNTFTDLYAGTLVNNVHIAHDAYSVTEGLQILCGDYTNNVSDIALGPTSLIRSDQGTLGAQPQLAGNTFDHTLNPVNCGSIHDWDMDDHWNDIAPYTDLTIDYHRHNVTICDPLCDAIEGSNPDLWDDYVGFATSFNKPTDCGHGILDNSHMIGDVQTAYVEARGFAIAARDLLEGNTNGGEKPDLLADLAQDHPWLGSSYLRDELILHSPLSDEVLDSMIVRAQPMDQWHITQVLVHNSPLNPGVYGLLKTSGVLSEFFMSVVLDAQQGQGLSIKQLLEKELLQRRDEQAGALSLLGWMWGTDTVNTTGVDSLRALFFQDGALDFTQARIELLIDEGDFAGASDQMSDLRPNYSGFAELRGLLSTGLAHGGDWSQLTTDEADSLRVYAERMVQGAGLMAGILGGNGLALPRVDPIFPRHTRAMQQEVVPVRDGRLDAIVAFPDPSDDLARITFPAELKGHKLEVIDAQGRLALSTLLTAPGMAELHTTSLASGVYQLCISGTSSSGRLLVKH